VEHREHEWEQQREQLSALLDQQLHGQERAALEAHLQQCRACQAELASLRRTKSLLRALPQPALPRSFTLSLEGSTQNTTTETGQARQPTPALAHRPTPLPRSSAPRRRRPALVIQWLSAVAAVLGLLILLSSAFSTLSFGGRAANSAAPVSNAQSGTGSTYKQTPAATQPLSHPTSNTIPTEGTPVGVRPTPPATPTQNAPSVGSSDGTPAAPPSPLLSATGLGILLLLLGMCGFISAWILRRRW
jgi:anti-sigma factor RsiW